MKTSSRGPFARIRWFCNDGSILPPKPYACRDHDGGVQHGQWTDRVERLRNGGYYIANILASVDLSLITNSPGYSDLYNQILIEKFLIADDDGWIFRKARYYRGAVQAENETAMARELLLGLAGKDVWNLRGFIPLRIGANLLDHGVDTTSVAKVRQQSLALSEKDKGFLPLRVKMHNQPDREDAQRVRDYAADIHDPGLAGEYERLAVEIDKVFTPESASKRLKEVKKKLSGNAELAREFTAAVKVLDSLLRDANQLVGLRHELFGQDVGAGLRSLNPGLARGKLRLNSAERHQDFDPKGIYLLPETMAELPPVAGILTAGEGNPLSHVQLLARNLGIPNVTVDGSLIPELTVYEGQNVILAASPAGSVQLMLDKGQLNHIFAQQTASASLIRPDLQKLDLKTHRFIPLSRLRATDSGRIVGPKAANLGELYYHYPEAVADGLTIPFGVFRSFLDQPFKNGKQSIFEWMEAEYAKILAMPPGSTARDEKMEFVRQELENGILKVVFDDDFRQRLAAAMETVFGPDGTYGVFVRSDTNVEDLPGFTGAGLNKTIPNVVGFENILAAIPIVWASPFSKRAFAWRQSHMEQPQHVYASVLLMRSIPSAKSGVMVTRNIDTGEKGWLSVAVNEGVGGAVDGQAAEYLRINVKTGDVRMLTQATAPWRRVLKSSGGVDKELVEGSETVLKPDESQQLMDLAQDLPQRYPSILDANGNPTPADIEFGFVRGKLQLFQIRPFLESIQARSNDYLNSLDKNMKSQLDQSVNLDERP